MGKIKSITAREILDCKGNPTVEATVELDDGSIGIGSCPSRVSNGKYEAKELRDNDPARFRGLGVINAVHTIEQQIAPKLMSIDATRQGDVDKIMIELDGTPDKSKIGANTMLSVSIAVAKAAAKSSLLPLYLYLRQYINSQNLPPKIPVPLFNLINGGSHAGELLDFQEFLIIPASFKKYGESLQLGVTVYKNLHDVLAKLRFATLLGDQGGYAPSLATNEDAFVLFNQALSKSGLRLGYDVFCGLDAAANDIATAQQYKIKDKSMSLSSNEMIGYYTDLIKKYHILYLEDPLAEDDWDGWTMINKTTNGEVTISGDDITATNPMRLQMALDKKAISGIVIKPSQIGTVLETLAVAEVARTAGLKITVSGRSGETMDTFIADLAVAVSADYMKMGAPARGERVTKYNRLLQIEKQLTAIG